MPPLVQIALLLAVAAVATSALPASLLSDAKEAQANANKRAQEVIMFGNQQNRPAEVFNSLPTIKKRAAPEEEAALPTAPAPSTEPPASDSDERDDQLTPRHVQEHVISAEDLLAEMRKEAHDSSKTVAQYEKGYMYGVGKEALEKQAENSLLKSDIYGDPTTTVNEYRYYGGGDPRHEKLAPPNKRSIRVPRVDANSRLKRDLELDPESLLALISLWQSQRNSHPNYRDRSDWTNSRYGYVRPEPEENNEEEEEEEIPNENNNGEWLDAPVTPTRYQYQDVANQYSQYPAEEYRYNTYPNMKRSLGGGYYPVYPRYEQKMAGGQWGGFTQDKRFMVAKKRQFNRWDEPMLARLLASQPRNPEMVAHRRLIL